MPLTCAETYNDRTTFITVNNRSRYKILDMQVRLLDLSGNVPIGFVSDTGFFVLVTSQDPGVVSTIDPCVAGGSPKPCQATKFEWTYSILDKDANTSWGPYRGGTEDGDHSTYYPGLTFTQNNFVDSAKALEATIINLAMPEQRLK